MATTSRYPSEMPGLFTPSPSHARPNPVTCYFDPASRFAFAPETSGRQVTDPDAHETRKRPRSRYSERDYTTAQGFATQYWGIDSLQHSQYSGISSPPPLADDRYELAGGGLDQPYQLHRQQGDCDDYFQLQNQRGMWSIPPTPHTGAVKRPATDDGQTSPSQTRSWSIMGLVGGVAGKLFQFCTVPFRGFQAGGGQKFSIEAHDEIAAKLGLQDDPFSPRSAGPVQHATPLDFPNDAYGVESMDLLESERPRMTKRLRTADNWVVIGTDGEAESRPNTPRLSERRVPSTMTPSYIPRPVSRSSAVTPSLKRPSLIPVSRRSTTDRRSFNNSAKAQPRQRSYSRQSFGSPVTFESKASNNKPKSPMPKETQRLINRVRRDEMEEDARMRRMSSQMSAMLREAREALGSKFEVEEFDDDDGSAAQPPKWYS